MDLQNERQLLRDTAAAVIQEIDKAPYWRGCFSVLLIETPASIIFQTIGGLFMMPLEVLYWIAFVFTLGNLPFGRPVDYYWDKVTFWSEAISVPWLIARFSRLKRIRKTLDPIMESKVEYMFVIKNSDLKRLASFSKHEDALAAGLLVKKSVKELLPGAVQFPKIMFVSHKWIGNSPDINRSILDQVIAHIDHRAKAESQTATNLPKYVWFDYMCVPQDDVMERNRHLRAIPDVLKVSGLKVFHIDQNTMNAYHSSIWCQLEYLTTSGAKFNSSTQWTIYDPDDLYSVLGGFIQYACWSRSTVGIFTDRHQAQIFKSILQFFINHHDSKNGTLANITA
jgi:hypothetical protein